ncbi:hemerythrin domain-containing protein [Sciscionella marina]|uniref:hemerythrin domain-containing protein n=1 Tax=Sciscionella marina TaxID=508770 RepID=UPI000363673F|nr:hemerythrin domain-containing protein [Sciscionella marina]
MPDITELILDDHQEFRRRFAALDEVDTPEELAKIWRPLSALLDLHAVAEERIFYPELVHRGSDAEDETVDAVDDHNQIRDAVHEADSYPVGSAPWSSAVRRARLENSEHMAEEEDGALADFRRHADPGLRADLGARFAAFKQEHPAAAGLDTSDIAPNRYLASVEAEGAGDGSLGLGPLDGRRNG